MLVAVPMIIAMVILGSRSDVMGTLTLPAWLRIFGWGTAALMGFASAGMFFS